MKVKTGGGGIDADGNWYELPTVESEMPDGWFEEAIQKVFAEGAKPTHMLADRKFLRALRKASK